MKTKNKNKIIKTLKNIKKDCNSLKKHNDLTEYGQAQLHLTNMILGELESD